MTRGRFIVLEGIDGSGTTTQAKCLEAALAARGVDVVTTCEPTPGPAGRLIRQALQRKLVGPDGTSPYALSWSAMALLFAADRVDHVETLVRPALDAGKTVVSDRYVLSSLAYQSVTSPEGEGAIPWIREINARRLPADLTIVIDVDDDVAAARRAARGGPPELFEVREIQRKLVGMYARAAELLPGERVVHVADGSLDDVTARVLAAVESG
ncbi:MAG TPA: dTMP kinase [Polyangiaceae bacterium]|nr:dTMP kinase [Polyangiaceae bacterium]